MILLAIDWSVIGIKTLQFLLSFSILVALHELGHFVAARIFGCRVEKFYLFFDPWFSLFKKKVGDTEYGVGWIPLGGYVKIAGMVDESMDKEQMKQPAKPHEFRSKPAWQRLIIMLAGIIVNLVLGFFIYAMILWSWGEEYLPASEARYGIATDSTAQSIGFRDGDKILSVDGKQYEKFRDINKHILLRKTHSVMVERDGKRVNIAIPDNIAKTLIANKNVSFITPRIPNVPIQKVVDTAAAGKAGIKDGDKILAGNDQRFQFENEVRNFIKTNKGKTVNFTILRGTDTLHLPATVSKEGAIGVHFSVPDLEKYFNIKKIKYSFFESIPAGFTKTRETLEDYWLQIKLIFGGKVAAKDSVGSLITIGSIFPATWDWQAFWSLTAFFSLVLAFMNLLPIPALDGGHALFCLYEMITGRKPSDKFMEVAQTIGMIILFGLMIFALGNDILRLFR